VAEAEATVAEAEAIVAEVAATVAEAAAIVAEAAAIVAEVAAIAVEGEDQAILYHAAVPKVVTLALTEGRCPSVVVHRVASGEVDHQTSNLAYTCKSILNVARQVPAETY
jgi:hypothetical protein